MSKRVVVTGGGGFIGAYLVKKLVWDGWQVAVVDSMVRGDASRFAEVASDVELFTCDVRDQDALEKAFAGAEVVMHLAAINGTENFYKQPELVLDVGLRGALAVTNAGRAAGVPDLIVASTAEVYQTPEIIPTPETIPLMLPDSLNPRYSYGGGKIVSELIAFNYGQDHYRQVQVFRPHNVFGPNMGWKHVEPQFILRALGCQESGDPTFSIQGDGSETRSFCYVDDIVDGILTMYEKGGHREIYHLGSDEELSVRELATRIGRAVGVELEIKPGELQAGGTPRRCPDISKMRALGWSPQVALDDGLARTVAWYREHRNDVPANDLM
ncbi:SDR family NAD(P)-dependent oxidoreductase [Mycobacterium sp. CBMA293]|uniref:NAD-dependent epimerase/dehydratase family protein n=1 Tax=unclassified Mycolicibacterium TaxID=2636767 RepID=UPI001326679C|nr:MULTISPECIES: SDR family NAD(P)-dependent oxidoreductase [unclassified Mycolicibacterium]MUL46787.1 SDR family NAD(P)-dependent oxidoreductase [Mycolicibacterium sp. CBMA 360]MUL92516.1 SDR family NAD(P)-dependent oxidoreductase [Mycolicibacterium sp. CBMA 230]MUL57428.1 SDR family NAD(P)-dependent oxidoreductase [Mycolicibacterium sp. CBMA 335]MUL70468.1 SDR family NAD(P)-dependent oxidoreductase [Mycolicibacterium sp. CBMA 311]MUM12401.1 SDR family NAD(P)-dependent oxidoreductase [Mycolic